MRSKYSSLSENGFFVKGRFLKPKYRIVFTANKINKW